MLRKYFILKKVGGSKTQYIGSDWRDNYLTTDIDEARQFKTLDEIDSEFMRDGQTDYPDFSTSEYEIISRITFNKPEDDE